MASYKTEQDKAFIEASTIVPLPLKKFKVYLYNALISKKHLKKKYEWLLASDIALRTPH